jgi:hypothetical protein
MNDRSWVIALIAYRLVADNTPPNINIASK